MSAISNKDKTRRAFFSDVTASTALAAVAMAQFGAPTAAVAQEKKEPSDNFRMPQNLPPWPKGTTGNKYDHLFCTRMKEKPLTDYRRAPTASLCSVSFAEFPQRGCVVLFA